MSLIPAQLRDVIKELIASVHQAWGHEYPHDASVGPAGPTGPTGPAGASHDEVTVSGTPDYITLSGQDIVRGKVDLTADVENDLPVADGGTGASTAQAAIDTLSAVSGATNEHVLTKDTGTGNAVFKAAAGGGGELQKAITVKNPTASQDDTIFFTTVAITLDEMEVVLVGASTPSVTFNIVHDPDRSAAGNNVFTSDQVVTNVTTGDNLTSFNDGTIPADSFVWLETQAQSGTVEEFHVTLHWTED